MLKLFCLILTSMLSMATIAAEVERLSGNGTLVRRLVSTPLTEKVVLLNGDEIKLGLASEALVRISQNVAFVLRAGSSITVSDVTNETGFAVRLISGALRYVSRLTGVDNFRLTSPHTALGVRGTDFDILVLSDSVDGGRPSGTYVTVGSGAVDVTDNISGVVAIVTQAQSVFARAREQDPNAIVAQAEIPSTPGSTMTDGDHARLSRSLNRSALGSLAILSLERVSDGLWRIAPFSLERGEFDHLLSN